MRINLNSGELKEFAKKLEHFTGDEKDEFIDKCAKELAARLLRKVVKLTLPYDKYPKSGDKVEFTANIPERQVHFTTKDGKEVSFTAKAKVKRVSFIIKNGGRVGGTLRRGWTASTEEEAVKGTGNGTDVTKFVNSIKVNKNGKTHVITIFNPVSYARYWEYGHRTSNKSGWVRGHFALTKSTDEVNSIAPNLVKKRFEEKLKEVFG